MEEDFYISAVMANVTRRIVACLLALALSACASNNNDTSANPASPEPTLVLVEPSANGFVATFQFHEDAKAWVFHRSALRRRDRKPWRADSWTIQTPGVALQRIGRHDALVASSGVVPRLVSIAFEPAAVDLIADYDPALIFTDGTTAIFAGAFMAFPMDDLDRLETMDEPLGWPTSIQFSDPGRNVMYKGRHVDVATDDGEAYVIYGAPAIAEDAAVALLADPALPEWLEGQLKNSTPAVFRFYRDRLGEHAGPRPMVIASMVQSDLRGISQGGSVLPGMITMRFEGDGLRTPNPRVVSGSLWFIAHEAAHFWLGQTIRYDNRSRAWITEGGADLMAMRASEALAPGFSAQPMLEAARIDCEAALAQGGIEAARFRNEQRPYYACGSLFALVVEQAGQQRGEDYFDFVSQLISARRDGEISGEAWLAAAHAFGVDEKKVAIMRRLLESGSENAATDIESLIGG